MRNDEDSVGDFCKKMEQSVGVWFNDYRYPNNDVISFENCIGDGGEQDYKDYENSWKTNVGEKIEDIIKKTVQTKLCENKNVEMPNDIIETDNIGEVIEKLAILHCRMWYLEDRIGELILLNDPEYNQEIVDLKKKIDICFKQKRPKYVQAINFMINNAIVNNKKLIEDSVKIYKGYSEE